MAKFKITPRTDIYIEDIEAEDAESALAAFAAGMDSDMYTYFNAEPAEMTDEEAQSKGLTPYYVKFKVDARYTAKVFATDPKDARNKATYKFSDANFNEAEDVDGIDIYVEDDNGNFVWER